ncbi:twin-arginine translocase TatA/TatE family subunit [Dermacoccaceae bacterium W4C1]
MFGIDGWEVLILLVLAMVVIGPDKLPEYVAKAREGIRKARDAADGAKGQLKEQMGPDFEDINWRQYDPRQYDPRKIVRQALFDEPGQNQQNPDQAAGHVAPPPEAQPAYEDPYAPAKFDPDRATPWDVDAT